MIFIAVIFTLASAWVEVKFYREYPKLADFMMKHRGLQLVASLLLSAFMGMCFGAAGVIALVAGVTSIIITGPTLRFLILKDRAVAKVKAGVAKLPVLGKGQSQLPLD